MASPPPSIDTLSQIDSFVSADLSNTNKMTTTATTNKSNITANNNLCTSFGPSINCTNSTCSTNTTNIINNATSTSSNAFLVAPAAPAVPPVPPVSAVSTVETRAIDSGYVADVNDYHLTRPVSHESTLTSPDSADTPDTSPLLTTHATHRTHGTHGTNGTHGTQGTHASRTRSKRSKTPSSDSLSNASDASNASEPCERDDSVVSDAWEKSGSRQYFRHLATRLRHYDSDYFTQSYDYNNKRNKRIGTDKAYFTAPEGAYGTDINNNQIGTKLSPNDEEKEKQKKRRMQMNIAAICGFVPEYGFVIGESLIVPFLLSLGAPEWTTSYVWFFSPLLDVYLQPCYGALSDKYATIPNACGGLGGRKPFILLFAIIISLAMAVTPHVNQIAASILGSSETSENVVTWCGIVLCIISYTAMDMSHGHLLNPSRAIVNDIALKNDEIEIGNSKFALWQAVGRAVGYILVSLDWPHIFSSGDNLHEISQMFGMTDQISACFTLSLIPLWIIIIIVMVCVPSQTKRLWRVQTVANTKNDEIEIKMDGMASTPVSEAFEEKCDPVDSLAKATGSSNGSEKNKISSNGSNGATSLASIEIEDESNETIEKKQKKWKLPIDIWIYWWIFTCGWLSIDAVALYVSSYVAIDLFGGSADTKNVDGYEKFLLGLRFAMGALFIGAVVSMITSYAILPWVNKKFGVKRVFFVTQMLMNVNYLLLYVCSDDFNRYVFDGDKDYDNNYNKDLRCGCFVMITIMSGCLIQFHYCNVYILIEEELHVRKKESYRGYVGGIFNLSIMLPALLIAVLSGWIIEWFDKKLIYGIVLWCVFAVVADIGLFIIYFVRAKRMNQKRLENIWNGLKNLKSLKNLKTTSSAQPGEKTELLQSDAREGTGSSGGGGSSKWYGSIASLSDAKKSKLFEKTVKRKKWISDQTKRRAQRLKMEQNDVDTSDGES